MSKPYETVGTRRQPDITFVGDVMVGRFVEASIHRRGLIPSAKSVAALLEGKGVGNLECPLHDAGPATLSKPDGGPNLHASAAMAAWLKEAGFDALCLANNHMMDCGTAGLASTVTALRDAGIQFFGAGDNYRQAIAPAIMEISGRRIALVGFGNGPAAGRKTAGVAPLRTQAVLDALGDLSCDIDATIVMLHGGIEYLQYPESWMSELAHDALLAGADMVLCGHSHCLRGLKREGEKSIYFGLGDFAMDTAEPQLQKHHLERTALTRLDYEISQPRMCLQSIAVDARLCPRHRLDVSHRPIVVGEDFLPRLPDARQEQQWLVDFDRLCQAVNDGDSVEMKQALQIEAAYSRMYGSGRRPVDYLTMPLRLRPRHIKKLIRRLASMGLPTGGVC